MDLGKNLNSSIRALRFYFRSMDFPLFAATVALLLFGLLNLYGIAGWEGIFLKKQAVSVLVGMGAMTFMSFFNYRYFKNYTVPVILFYIFSLGLLTLTFFSPAIRGIHAWLIIGNLTLEPSEFMKLGLIILLAKYFSQRHIHINQFRHIFVSGLYAGIPLLVVFVQPDLGSAAIIGLIWFGIVMAAGINRKHLFFLGVGALIVAYIGWAFVLKPYQQERLLSFMNPQEDPMGAGYNIIQSKIAIGSGSWLGNGLGNGSQATLGFLPEPHNDFVFSAMTEQFGFAGVILVLGTLFLFLSRIFTIGLRAENNFSKLFALGTGIFIFSHVCIGAAVNLGLLPITGIPFSFLSYGGSHLIVVMTSLGIIQSIKRYG